MITDFSGLYTALVTPMRPNKNARKGFSVEFGLFRRLVEYQIDNLVDWVVPIGTTGEAPTLTKAEKKELIKIAVETAGNSGKDAKVMAGAGTNDTFETLDNMWEAYEAGANAAMVVVPYYNKPNLSGMFKHYEKLEEILLPVIVYNIPGRCGDGVDLSGDKYFPVLKDIANLKNVVGIKEASGKLPQIERVINEIKKPLAERGKNFAVLAGDDNMALTVIRAGGDGVVSVASNLAPYHMKVMVDAGLRKNYALAERYNLSMEQFFKLEFCESNPAPIKEMMRLAGFLNHASCRLPLGPLQPENMEKLSQFMHSGAGSFCNNFNKRKSR